MSLANRSNASLFQSERQEYRLMFFLSFPLFLAVAVLSRLVPAQFRPIPLDRTGGFFSVLRDARAAAHSVLPYAFMR